MDKAKLMLSSVLHHENKIDRTILIRYYIDEYKLKNPIFLSHFFKILIRHIYISKDLELLELLFDNFSQEFSKYSYESIRYLNLVINHLSNRYDIKLILKIAPAITSVGNKTTVRFLKNFLRKMDKNSYISQKDIYILKKALFDLETNITDVKKSLKKLNIIGSDELGVWKKVNL